MPIYRDKARGRLVFEFDRYIGGQRVRTRKILPRAWTQAQADAFDRRESGRLYSIATGDATEERTIDEAVTCYLQRRIPELKTGRGIAQELAWIAWAYQGRALSQLPDVCAEYAEAERGKLAPATITNRIRYLCAACRYAWKHARMCKHDPAATVMTPKFNNERQEYVDRREMLQLAKACRHRAVRAAIRIAWYSGMRWGEIVAAERDLTLQAFVLRDTKNGRPRIVPMVPRLRVCAGYAMPSRFTANYHWVKAREACGMQHLHFHDLRHSTATALVAQGHSLHLVASILGHKSLASSKRYAHHATGQQAAALGGLGKKIPPPPPKKAG